MKSLDSEIYAGHEWDPPLSEVRGLLIDPTTNALVLFTILAKYIEPEILFGDAENPPEPLEIWEECRAQFNVDLPVDNQTRINAMIHGLTNPMAAMQVSTFHAVVLGIARGDIDSLINDDPHDDDVTAGEIMMTLACLGTIMGEPYEVSPAIKRYIANEIAEEVNAPEDGEDEDPLEDIVRDFEKIEMPEAVIHQLVADWQIAEEFK